jgi:metallo-beta-lactamase class B
MKAATSVKFSALILYVITLAGCAPVKPALSDSSAQAQSRVSLVTQCKGHDGWSDPAPPAHVFGNVYMVGTCGIVSLLITSPQGHILIDGATKDAAQGIAANIAMLGFDPKDVRYILSSHEHHDHAGGLATLKGITGAVMVARAESKAVLESGKPGASDPQFGAIDNFPGVKVDRVIADGEHLRLGTLDLMAIATPAHSPGSTSWTWRSCEGKTCRSIVYADSLSAISADAYRFSDHPDYVATFRKTLSRVAKISPCDILITPHPVSSSFFERLSGDVPLVNVQACSAYAAQALQKLEARLAKEDGR